MIPTLSHKRFFIAHLLLFGPKWGRELRSAINERGWTIEETKFSAFMLKLEAQGIVSAEIEPQKIKGRTYYGNIYTLTSLGRELYSQTIDWYRLLGSLAPTTKGEHAKA